MVLLKLALRPWKYTPWTQVLTVLTHGILLTLGGALVGAGMGLEPLIHRLQTDQVITAYLSSSVSREQEEKVVDEIKLSLGAASLTQVDVQFTGVEDFIRDLRESYPDLGEELLGVTAELETLVPRYVTIAGKLPADLVQKIKKVTGLDSVETSQNKFESLVSIFRSVRLVSWALAMGVFLALLSSFLYLSRVLSQLNAGTIHLLRFWGAGVVSLRIPALLSGALVGTAGGILAMGAWIGLSQWFSHRVQSLSPFLMELTLPGVKMGLALFGMSLLLGVLSGWMGSQSGRSSVWSVRT